MRSTKAQSIQEKKGPIGPGNAYISGETYLSEGIREVGSHISGNPGLHGNKGAVQQHWDVDSPVGAKEVGADYGGQINHFF